MRRRVHEALCSDIARFTALCMLVVSVFLLGGGSRADILSLVVLRPLAFLFAAYALIVIEPAQLRAVRRPAILLLALALLAAIQSIPLPPQLWEQLPGRALLARIAEDLGENAGYRPLSLAPARTMNTLLSLGVPLAAVLLVAAQRDAGRRRLPLVLAVAAAASALVAVAQLGGLAGDSLYLYRVTNSGLPVGLFANRNHQALLMAVMLVLFAETYRRATKAGKVRSLISMGLLLIGVLALVLILVSGSRAGLLCGGIGAVAATSIVWRGASRATGAAPNRYCTWAIAATAIGAGALVAATFFLSRAESINRALTFDALEDYRAQRFSLLMQMLHDHWAAGIGFGAFEGVFHRYETVDALTPFIFNQAHNDWLQFPMEGGVLGTLILLAALALFAAKAIPALGNALRGRIGGDFALVVVVILIAVASVFDYPLRTPIFMLVAAVAFTLLVSRDKRHAET